MNSLPLSDDCPLVNGYIFKAVPSKGREWSELTYAETVESGDRKLQIRFKIYM